MCTRLSVQLSLAAAVAASLATSASAGDTTKFLWRLGENDPGAVAGGATNNPTTAAIGPNLGKVSSPTSFQYSSSVPTLSASASTLSVNFGAKSVPDIYQVLTGLSFPTDTWVAEGWFKPADTTGSKSLAFFGDFYGQMQSAIGPTGPDGYGFYQIGDRYYAAFAGIGFRDMGAAVPGQWTHLAIVRDSANYTGDSQGVRLYVNGAQVAMTAIGAVPYTPVNAVTMGGSWDIDGGGAINEVNNGSVDNLRYGTFRSGTFGIADLDVANASVWRVGSGNWKTSGNWNGAIPNATDAYARFLQQPSARTITINSQVTVGTLSINSSNAYTYSGLGSLKLLASNKHAAQVKVLQGNHTINVPINAANTTAQNVFDIASGATLTAGRTISGANITKTGTGELVMAVSNNYTGPTIIKEGLIESRHYRSFGLDGTTSPVIIEDGAGMRWKWTSTVDYAGHVKPIIVRGAGPGGYGALQQITDANSFDVGWAGITFAADTTVRVGGANYGVMALGIIDGSGKITKVGNQGFDLELGSPNFSGEIEIQEGWLSLRHFADAAGTSPKITIGNGTSLQIIYDGLEGDPGTGITFNTHNLDFGPVGTGSSPLWMINNTTTTENRNTVWSGNVQLTNDVTIQVVKANDLLTLNGAVAGPGGIAKAGAGTLILNNAANSQARGIWANAGKLVLGANQSVNGLSIASGAKVEIAAGGDKLLQVTGLTASGQLDVKDNDTVVHNGNATTLSGLVASGRGSSSNPTWTGNGIISTIAKAYKDAQGVDLFTVGVVLNSDFTNFSLPEMSTFSGASVTGTDVLLKYTYSGDANLDGLIDASDYQLIDMGYNGQLDARWLAGDFNYDGVINAADYQLIDLAYGLQSGILAPGGIVDVVPEPASLSVLAVGAMGLLARRRRN